MNGQLPSNPEEKTRLTTLDLLKGAAIIGVVIFHVALTQAHGPDPETATGIGLMTFKSIPYSLLCTFIVISGYFYVSGRSFLENVRRRALKLAVYLIVAIVVLTSLMYLILWIQGGYDLELSQLWDVIWENVIGKGAFKTFDEISVYGGFVLAPFVTFDTTTWIPIGTVAGIALALITVTIIVCAARIYCAYRDGKFRKTAE